MDQADNNNLDKPLVIVEDSSIDTNNSAILRALECSLCLSLICEPITISCGHTFCRVCIVKSLTRHKKRCPTCREICHAAPENAAENIMIKSLAVAIDQTTYFLRLAEAQIEKETWKTLYPIFYYNTIMFPGSRLSLHLFEPRYKLMMQRVVNTTRAFAYVPNFTNYVATIGDIALVTELKEVEFLPDGRCLLDSVLSKRHKIVDHYVEEGTQGLHFCRVEPLLDDPISESNLPIAEELKEQILTLINNLMTNPSAKSAIDKRYGPMPTELEAFSLWATAVCGVSDERLKLHLLTTTDTLNRLSYALRFLVQLVSSSTIQSQIQHTVSNISSTATRAVAAIGQLFNGLNNDSNDVDSNNNNNNASSESDSNNNNENGGESSDDNINNNSNNNTNRGDNFNNPDEDEDEYIDEVDDDGFDFDGNDYTGYYENGVENDYSEGDDGYDTSQDEDY